jgi:hypothetical protein
MRRILLTSCSLALLSGPTLAQCWQQHLEVGVTDPRIPSGLALAPGRLALGQPRIDPYANPAIVDIVRVFEGAPGNLLEVAALMSSLGHQTSASFGTALDMEGDWLAVGDPAASDPVLGSGGAVHLYRRSAAGWALETVLTTPPAGILLRTSFGTSLDLDGDLLVVGAPFATTVNTQNVIEDGVVFVFHRGAAGWALSQTLTPQTAQLFGGFGRSVALDGDRLAIGSIGDPVPGGSTFSGGSAGAVHLFERLGAAPFGPTTVIQAAQPTAGAALGWSVDVDGDLIAAGAIGGAQGGHSFAGRAHVFERDALGNWSEVADLTVAPHRAHQRFGDDVEFAGGTLYVTSDGLACAWSYQRIGGAWTEVQRFTTEAGVAWPIQMPVRVRALGGDVVLTDPEGATVFSAQPQGSAGIGCAAVPLPSTNPGFPGPPVYLDVRSEQRLSLPTLELAVFGGSSVGNGILFYGFAPASVPLGSGTRCVGGALARAAFGVSTPGALVTPLSLALQAPPVSAGALAITPGVATHFQYWFRTPSGTTHLTNSLVLSFCP